MTTQKLKDILSKHFPDMSLTEDALRCIASSINKSIREQESPPSSDVPEGWVELTDEEKTGQWINGAKFHYNHKWIYNEIRNSGAFARSGHRIIIPVSKTFESHGLVWTRHKPGNPMPCKPDDKVCVIYDKDDMFRGGYIEAKCFDWLNSSGHTPITGWRYAEKKIVKLGPSDIPAGSVFRFNGGEAIFQWTRIKKDGINFAGNVNVWYTFEELKNSKFEINRPKNRDADGNPTLWEPCSKEEV